jgi:ketosteroid isomerase-like protein
MSLRTLAWTAILSMAVVAVAVVPPAIGDDSAQTRGRDRMCERAFESTQRQDMESFGAYDAEAFAAVHRPDAVSVFPDGTVANGLDEIMAFLASHFENREATWEYAELSRTVDGCRAAFIVYDTTYSIPRIGYSQRSIVGVTYTWQRGPLPWQPGRWLVMSDLNTPVTSS